MNLVIINVKLMAVEECDNLIFFLDEHNNPGGISVNLNSENGQLELKKVFSKLLEIALNSKIKLEFSIGDGYTKGLYKDVCSEYIEDLNREIQRIHEDMRKELNLSQ